MNKFTLRKHAVKSVIWTITAAAAILLFKGIITMNTVETIVAAAGLYAAMFAENAFMELVGESVE